MILALGLYELHFGLTGLTLHYSVRGVYTCIVSKIIDDQGLAVKAFMLLILVFATLFLEEVLL